MVDIYVGPSNTHWTLHEKLLCYRSRFFRNIFYPKNKNSNAKKNHAYGLPEEDDEPFKLFVGWLYSERVPQPKEEKDLNALLDVYLMAEKWEIRKLIVEVLDAVRGFYHETDSMPSLRRVQYIYSNTEAESPMRQLLVNCVARMLVLGNGVPSHWENALRKNGQLAVDIILATQKWHISPEDVPDARTESVVPIADEAQEKGMKMQDDEDDVLDWGEGLSFSEEVSEQSRSNSQAGTTLVNGQ